MSHPASGNPPAVQAATAWKRWLGLALGLTAIAVVVSSDVLHRLLLSLVGIGEAAITAHPVWGAVAFVAFAALSAILAFFSSALLVPVAVATWGEPSSIVLLWTGWFAGGAAAYAIGRWLGRAVAGALVSGETLERFQARITSSTPFGLVLLFQLALPSEIPGYVLGLARYRLFSYLLALGIAELPFAVGTVYLGESFLQRRLLTFLALAACGSLLSTWAFRALQKRLLHPADHVIGE